MILFFQKLSLKSRFVGVLLTFFLFLGFFVFFNGTSWGVSQLKMVSGGTGLLDAQFWYTPKMVLQVLTDWGDAGRDYFREILLPVDMAFPLAYVLFFSVFSLYMLKRINPERTFWYLLPTLGFVAAAFDYCENFTLLILTFQFPSPWEGLCWVSASFTLGKWIFLGLASLAAVILVMAHFFQRLKARLRAQ